MSGGGRRILFTEIVASSDHDHDPEVAAKFYAVMEAVADRVEMHQNIGEQRNNWNNLLLICINAMTLSAAMMTGMAAIAANGGTLLSLKLSSAVLYASVTAMLVVMNVIQPSQLAEEHRNASRSFKQLHRELQTVVALVSSSPTVCDVNEATERVLALDKAFPLPLLGDKMIEKFPNVVEPAVWWPQRIMWSKKTGKVNGNNNNGWNLKLEEEMRNIVGVLKTKDMDDYMKLGEKALKLNKMLAISGPILTGIAAIGSAFVGTTNGSLAVMVGVICGAMASVVSTFEHGGQVGMVFEMYRSNAGFFKLMQETIESNVNERDVERRENGEVFQTKVALQLGRSLSELRHLAASAASSSSSDEEEFASKLF
ncbi:hypothetical protein EZV62_026263 [Acer yangbiense]|uniref:F-box protein n=1 Tax=Acer yangbiense TaxID=1000413 RepID=A0A5C7GR49_9ROSI|nr:hypothetical protein EZV62_026263 [Acer yangbiense]